MTAEPDLDALRRSWRALETKLDAQQSLHLELLTESRVDKARARLRPLLVGQVLQAAIGVVGTLFFGGFWIAHVADPTALVSGLLMHAWSVALVVSAVREIVLVKRIDYARPVLDIQKSLGQLQVWRTRRAPLLGLAFWVLWLPLVEVGLVHASGHGVSGAYLWANLGVGVLGLAGTWAVMRHLRRSGHRIVDAIDADNAGRGLGSAQELLADLRRLEGA